MLRRILAAALVVSAASARADDTVDLVGGWNMTWNISGGSISPAQDIQIDNPAASSDPIFNAYDLGLIFQRVEGSGQIALHTASNPASNSIVPAWLGTPEIGSGATLLGPERRP